MVKRLSAQKSRSSFAELISLHNQTVEQAPESVAAIAGKQRGKSASPDYIKLTSYIRRETHLAVKKRTCRRVDDKLASQHREREALAGGAKRVFSISQGVHTRIG